MNINIKESSVIYPIDQIVNKATFKLKVHDRGIPFTSDVFGRFPTLVKRVARLNRWKSDGVTLVKVFYTPQYFHSLPFELLDPAHTYQVIKYAGIK